MEWRMDTELEREPDYPPEWWNYTIEIQRDSDGYVASVKELPGCITQGDTLKELFEMIEDAIISYLEFCKCGNELTAQDIETDQECCEDCR